MSFSSEVKKELCSVNAVDTEQKKAELYGLLIFSKVFKKDKIIAFSVATFCESVIILTRYRT